MPHYKDGTLAKEGDVVKGIPYNTQGKVVVGIINNINPGEETCNCMVSFMEELKRAGLENVYTFIDRNGGTHYIHIRSDYGEVRAFEKVL